MSYSLCRPLGSLLRGYKLFSVIFIITALQLPLKAQQEEILLALRHPSTGSVYINSIYDYNKDKVFLPLIELFNLLEINCEATAGGFEAKGLFLSNGNNYSVNLQRRQIIIHNKAYELNPEDFRLAEADLFLSPEVYATHFGLNFTVDLNYLVINLETKHSLPVSERKAREKARTGISNQAGLPSYYTLSHPRKRSLFAGTMLDYNVQGTYTPGKDTRMTYNLNGGFELLGGDVQGNLMGYVDPEGNKQVALDGARWRYVLGGNDFLQQVSVGQIQSTGILPFDITGVSISNEPIEPRRMFDVYIVDGNTEPESEVELYINDRISDYRRADANGYYRFEVPIMYGTTRVAYRIFTPSGEILESEKQIRIPFSYLPKGVFNYQLQAGNAEITTTSDSVEQIFAVNAVTAYGISKGITASVVAQHLGREWNGDDLMAYASISARIAKQYLVNLDISPGTFQRISASVWYPSNMSINFIYASYNETGYYNIRGAEEETSLNVYLPFMLFKGHSGLRMSAERVVLSGSSYLRYQGDLSTRLGRLNLRVNYSDNLLSTSGVNYFGEGLLSTSATYTLGQGQRLPDILQGWFLRGQCEYDLRNSRARSTELQLSRTLGRKGRINIVSSYLHQEQSFRLQAGITLDLNGIRSSTQAYMAGNIISMRQSLSGSLGWDMPNRKINFSNRQQVGRAAAGVRLFVDNNNNGSFDSGDQMLEGKAIRLDQSSLMKIGADSILRINQLQSYYRYNVEVNRNALDDPTLVPVIEHFSFIADPNQFKVIDIPFYRGGIVEGQVLIQKNNRMEGQSGLRLILRGENGYEQVFRTFNDGSFYIMDLPPSKYELRVDSLQLIFLNATLLKPLQFNIEPSAEGEYLENMQILLQSRQAEPSNPEDSRLDTLNGQAVPNKIQEIVPAINTNDSTNTIAPSVTSTGSHNVLPDPLIRIQAGAFRSHANALNVLREIEGLTRYPAVIVEEEGLFKVRISGLDSKEAAAELIRQLESLGIAASLVK